MLQLEKEVHVQKIQMTRMNYKGEIDKFQDQLDSVNHRISITERAIENFQKDTEDLESFETNVKSTKQNYEDEFEKLDALEEYLTFKADEIDFTNTAKREIRNK